MCSHEQWIREQFPRSIGSQVKEKSLNPEQRGLRTCAQKDYRDYYGQQLLHAFNSSPFQIGASTSFSLFLFHHYVTIGCVWHRYLVILAYKPLLPKKPCLGSNIQEATHEKEYNCSIGVADVVLGKMVWIRSLSFYSRVRK